MKARAMINAALSVRSRVVVHPQAPAKIIEATPATMIAPDLGDQEMIFRSMILRTQRDGADLVGALATMIATHPALASELILKASLGHVSQREAVVTLREYLATGVALASTQTL